MTADALLPTPTSLPLGLNGVLVSPIAWGMWRLENHSIAEAEILLNAALESGVTLLDTADIYGAGSSGGFGSVEAVLGEVLLRAPHLRKNIVLASKAGIVPGVPYDSSAHYLEGALEASLKRLHTDYLDLWQVHRPDILTHPQEVARVLEKAVASGKVRAIGVSNYTPAQIEALNALLDVPLSTTQPEFSPLHLQPLLDGQFDQAMRLNLRPLAWSPLAQGRIAAPIGAQALSIALALDKIADSDGVSRAAAAYSWIMAHPAGIIPIIGTMRPDRIREATDALKVVWSRADWYAVLEAAQGQKLQ